MADNILLFKQMLPVHSTGLEKEIKRISGKELDSLAISKFEDWDPGKWKSIKCMIMLTVC